MIVYFWMKFSRRGEVIATKHRIVISSILILILGACYGLLYLPNFDYDYIHCYNEYLVLCDCYFLLKIFFHKFGKI